VRKGMHFVAYLVQQRNTEKTEEKHAPASINDRDTPTSPSAPRPRAVPMIWSSTNGPR